MHTQFDELLHELELSPIIIKDMEEKVMEKIKCTLSDQDRQIRKKQNELKSVLQKIESLEEKFLNNEISNVTYEKWHHRTLVEKSIIDVELSDLKRPLEESWKFYNENLCKLEDLHYIYHKAQIHQKHSFIRAVFNNSLSYQDRIYRTPFCSRYLLIRYRYSKKKSCSKLNSFCQGMQI